MADNVTLNAGTGGASCATDDVGGVHFQKVKIDVGGDGVSAALSNSNPIPVSDAGGSLTVDNGGTFAVQATLQASTNTTEVVGDAAHDAAAAGNPLLVGAYASAAAPTDVSADADAVRLWALRSGALAMQPTYGGVLGVAGNGASGAGVQRVTIANDSTGVLATVSNVATIGTSVTPGTGATNLGKAEDAAHTTGDVGVMALAVRRDADTTLVDTTGDYAPLQVNAAGSLKVAITSGAGSGGTSIADGATFTRDTTSITPVGAVVESSAPTLTNGDAAGLSMTTAGALRVAVASGGVAGVVDDSAFTPGTTEGVVFMAHADETTPDSVDEGDAGALRMTLARALHINVRDDAGDSCMDGTNNALRVNIVAGAGSGGTAMTDDAAFTPASTSVTPIAGVLDDTTPDSVDEGDAGAVRMSANRNLYVRIRDNAGNERGLNIDANGALAATVTNATAGNLLCTATLAAGTNTNEVVGDVAQDAAVAGNPVLIGLRASTATPTAMSADGDAVYPWATREGATVIAGAVVDDAAFTPGTSRVVPIGFQADETATDSVDEGDAGTPRMTLDRKVITTEYAHAAAGGATPYYNLDVDETEDQVKATAGKLMALHVINLANAKRYLKIYNDTAANVVVGTTTPTLSFPIPTMGDTNGAGFTFPIPSCGIQFTTAITIAATTGFADNDTGAPGANEVIVNLAYI